MAERESAYETPIPIITKGFRKALSVAHQFAHHSKREYTLPRLHPGKDVAVRRRLKPCDPRPDLGNASVEHGNAPPPMIAPTVSRRHHRQVAGSSKGGSTASPLERPRRFLILPAFIRCAFCRPRRAQPMARCTTTAPSSSRATGRGWCRHPPVAWRARCLVLLAGHQLRRLVDQTADLVKRRPDAPDHEIPQQDPVGLVE